MSQFYVEKENANADINNMELCPKFSELNKLCPLQLMLVSKITPFVFLVAKTKGAQHGLKGQCVLVPTDLEKIQTILPRSWRWRVLDFSCFKKSIDWQECG